MTVLQEKRAGNSRLSFLDILLLLFLFASPVLNSILFFSGGTAASGQLARIYIVVAVGAVLNLIGKARSYISREMIFFLLLFALVGASYLLTGIHLGTNRLYFSELKAYVAMVVCVVLLTMNVFWTEKSEICLPAVFVLDIVVSAVSFFAVISYGGKDNGLIHDASGLLYQNISYYSASCFGMNMFLLKEQLLCERRSSIGMKLFLFVLGLVQIITCFLSGGRGGAVLALLLMLYGLVTVYGFSRLHKGVLAVAVAALLLVFFAPLLLNKLNLGTKGLARTLELFASDFRDRGRAQIYHSAFGYFLQRPVFGNGIAFFLVRRGIYSHNIAADILCESGMFGMLIILFVLGSYFRRTVHAYQSGSLYRFLTMVFLCGFTMNMFSGYIWVNQNVWLPVTIILSCTRPISNTAS